MKRLSHILLFCLITVYVSAEGIRSTFVDSIVNEAMSRMPHAGIAVGVIVDGKLVHSKGYGLTSITSGEKVDDNSLFCIASNSKAFTCTALGMLVDQGKLSWDDRVVDHIPEFRMYAAYVTDEFRIIDLLTHRSGLDLGQGDLMLVPDGSDYTIDDIIRSFRYHQPVSSFRTKYDYNNLLYLVAGEVIHRVTGLTWDKFVEQNIMAPLGMSRTRALYQNITDHSNIANPHRVESGKLVEFGAYVRDFGGFGAAGGIYSSVQDLSKWVIMHLNEGKYGEDQRLISGKNHDELWKPRTQIFFDATPTPPYRTHYQAYGLGFKLFDQNNLTVVQHSGGLPGMLSMVTMIPEIKAGIIVLTNCAPGGYSFVSITNEIKDELISVNGPDWIGRIENYLNTSQAHADSVVNATWAQVERNKKAKVEASKYVGLYLDPWFGEVEISEVNGQLWFKSVRSPKLSGPMFFYGENTFAIRWEYRDMECDAYATFGMNKEGVAESITMEGISPDIDFSFDFQHLNLTRTK